MWSCPGCHGFWLQNGRMPDDAETVSDTDSPAHPRREDHDARAGLCPEGHGLLTRAQTFIGEGFYLERCHHCAGIWFDAGEWQRVFAAGLADGLYTIWNASWQREQRVSDRQARYRRQLETALGAELLEQLGGLAETLAAHPERELAVAYFLRRLRPTEDDDRAE